MFKQIKHKIFSWLAIRDYPVVKVYNGFGNHEKIMIMGHVLSLSPRPRKTFNSNWFRNFFSVLRLFMVRTVKGATVSLKWGAETFEAVTESDGFFRLEFCPKLMVAPGWHPVTIFLKNDSLPNRSTGHGSVFVPSNTQVAYISDIDDTFLISHTSNLRKRLYVLLTHNGRSRKVFEGVINHYRQLATSGHLGKKDSNPFFYVSSSEWNLYDFLVEFTHFNYLPKGVFLLGQMKKIKDFWRSGQNNHGTKFMRIVRVIEAYPHQHFVLLGDDSQQDPTIYASIVEHFPKKILAVYLRRINRKNFEKVSETVKAIKNTGVECCYFQHSSEAIIHSKEIGLISK